jgi:hypothetical protein
MLGVRQAYHQNQMQRCQVEIDDIRDQLAANGVTPEHQAQAVRSRDVAIAQRIVAVHLLPEWRASEKAPQVMEALAQAIADAMQTARGGTPGNYISAWKNGIVGHMGIAAWL